MDKSFEKNDLVVYKDWTGWVYKIEYAHLIFLGIYVTTNIVTGEKGCIYAGNCRLATKEEIHKAITRRIVNGAQ